jgi:alkanesulfonate monooxygenase SsuD/methylene tetrahydromethanopterin reductase-like flavin-dependent oxidoreductase (luciferase family)
VAETDEKAMEEARPHIESLFNKFLSKTPEMMFPPGYLSAGSAKDMLKHKKQIRGHTTIEALVGAGIMLCGSPDTVRKQLVDAHRTLGFQNFLSLLQFGTLPRDLTDKNIRLFASEVMPALQQLTDREYAGFEARLAVAAS